MTRSNWDHSRWSPTTNEPWHLLLLLLLLLLRARSPSSDCAHTYSAAHLMPVGCLKHVWCVWGLWGAHWLNIMHQKQK